MREKERKRINLEREKSSEFKKRETDDYVRKRERENIDVMIIQN